MKPRRRVFVGEDVGVAFYDAGGDTVVYSFSDLLKAVEVEEPGEHFFSKVGLSVILVRAPRPHWWQSKEMPLALARAKMIAKDFDRRVAYGSSMGAYGALLWSGAVEADRVLAVSPQTSIAKDVFFTPKWREVIDSSPILYNDIAGTMPADLVPRILYDPRDKDDLRHIRWLSQRRKLQVELMPFAGHKILHTLKEMGQVSSVMERLLRDQIDSQELRSIFRTNRRRSVRFDQNLRRNLDERWRSGGSAA